MAHKRFNYFSFSTIFCPFTPLTARKIKIKKNIKNAWISSFYISVPKNYDQMMYSSWDMVHDRCNCYFSFWAIFCPFTPLTAQKIKILKKWKKHLEISSFYIRVPKIMIRWCMVSEIWWMTDVIVISHFGLLFALLPPSAQKIKILKKQKKLQEISSF